MFSGFGARPPVADMPVAIHVPGRNCMGPTAWSYIGSPSYRPPSVSRTTPVPDIDPSSLIPMIEGRTTPSEPITAPPNRPLADSTVPMAASSVQERWQLGRVRASVAAAAR
jgi:hypothetical protein